MNTTSFLNIVRPASHERYRQLPVFGVILDGFVDWAKSKGYTNSSIYLQLDSLRRLDRWLRRSHQSWSIGNLTEAGLLAAKRRFASQPRDARFAWGLTAVIRYLRETGRIAPLQTPLPTRSEAVVDHWLIHLHQDRGRAQSTLETRRRHITHFLRFISFDQNEQALKNLRLQSIHRFLAKAAHGLRRPTVQNIVGSLREFLRYQYLQSVIESPIHLWIDSVRIHRSEDLPYPIDWQELKRVLGRIDQSTPIGLRDHAILLLA